jgi:prepilin-type N-terminal cleavage/methylation domain-containing protein
MKGFTLIELLVAMSLTLVVCGAALWFVAPARDAFQVQPERADLQQRVRVGVEALRRELVMAGAGPDGLADAGPLLQVVAPVMPYRAFDGSDPAGGVYFRRDTISLMYVPVTPSQTTLASPLAAGSQELELGAVRGLDAGDQVLVVDQQGTWEVFEIDVVDSEAGRVRVRAAAAHAFPSGAIVAEVRAITYAVKPDSESDAYQLVQSRPFGTAQPVVNHVVKLEFQYFGERQPPRLIEEGANDTSEPRATYGPAPPRLSESRGPWPAGENCTFAVVDGRHEPRLASLGGDSSLVEMTPPTVEDGPWCPDVVAKNRYDADLLRIRRVRFTLRVQTALASLRGPAGALFMNAGTSRAGNRVVPDMEVQLDVTPRNLNVAP